MFENPNMLHPQPAPNASFGYGPAGLPTGRPLVYPPPPRYTPPPNPRNDFSRVGSYDDVKYMGPLPPANRRLDFGKDQGMALAGTHLGARYRVVRVMIIFSLLWRAC